MERKDDADYVKSGTRLVVKVITPASRPRKTWQSTLSANKGLLKVNPRTTQQKEMRVMGWCTANPSRLNPW